MNIYVSLLFTILRAAFRAQEDVVLENLALRHQFAILMRSARRPRLEPADRLLWSRPQSATPLRPRPSAVTVKNVGNLAP